LYLRDFYYNIIKEAGSLDFIMIKTIGLIFCLLFFKCAYDRFIKVAPPPQFHHEHSSKNKAVVGKHFSDTIVFYSSDTFTVEIVSLPKGAYFENPVISWVPAIFDTGKNSFIFIAKTEKYDDYLDTIVAYYDTLKYVVTVFDSAKYYDCPWGSDEPPQYIHGLTNKTIIGKPFFDTIRTEKYVCFQAKIISAPDNVNFNGTVISWTPTVSDIGKNSFCFFIRSQEYSDTLRLTLTVFDSSAYYDCPSAFDDRPQYRHGGANKAVVGKPYLDTIRTLHDECFQVKLISAPEGTGIKGPIISWKPSVSDTGIKSFCFIMRSHEFIDTLKYLLTVFDSASYFDFMPIQKGFYWIYKVQERQTQISRSGHPLPSLPDSAFPSNYMTYLNKIIIDSVWQNNDSLVIKITQKKYDGINHRMHYQPNPDTTYSLPDVDSSFTAIYSHNIFYKIDDLFLSKLFSFRYIKKTFIPNDSQYYKYSFCAGFYDDLQFESDRTIMIVSEGSCLHCLPDYCPASVRLNFKYASDVGLLEYNFSIDQNFLLNSNNQARNFKLIEYNVGPPVKAN
jgi:hypothetical protein